MKNFLYIFFIIALVACNQAEEKKVEIGSDTPSAKENKSEDFQMYQMSEMASFMEKMYADHRRMKSQIVAGEKVDSLNFELAKLYHATMTDSSDNDEAYQQMAKAFANYEEQLLKSSLAQQKDTYNNAVNLCIACHQQKCTGPIPRIKKLLIP